MNAWERPAPEEMASYYHRYVDRCPGKLLPEAMKNAAWAFTAVLKEIPKNKEEHRYAEGKWTVKEVVQHVIDSERIFAYRALRFARNDAAELAGFDENAYAPEAHAERRSLHDLIAEYEAVNGATQILFNSFNDEMLMRSGTANKNRMSVRAVGWVIAGHTLHHQHVLQERYLKT